MDRWETLSRLGVLEGELRAEALVLATERMRVVARNVDVVLARLRAAGWPVASWARMPVHRLVSDVNVFTRERREVSFPDVEGHLDALRTRARGPIPVVLEVFWREVGGVSLHADIDGPLPAWARGVRDEDVAPLDIVSLPELWETVRAEKVIESLELAGLTFEGHAPLRVRLPDGRLDPMLDGWDPPESLLGHLRRVLAAGGLPGLWAQPAAAEVLRGVARDLEPF